MSKGLDTRSNNVDCSLLKHMHYYYTPIQLIGNLLEVSIQKN